MSMVSHSSSVSGSRMPVGGASQAPVHGSEGSAIDFATLLGGAASDRRPEAPEAAGAVHAGDTEAVSRSPDPSAATTEQLVTRQPQSRREGGAARANPEPAMPDAQGEADLAITDRAAGVPPSGEIAASGEPSITQKRPPSGHLRKVADDAVTDRLPAAAADNAIPRFDSAVLRDQPTPSTAAGVVESSQPDTVPSSPIAGPPLLSAEASANRSLPGGAASGVATATATMTAPVHNLQSTAANVAATGDLFAPAPTDAGIEPMHSDFSAWLQTQAQEHGDEIFAPAEAEGARGGGIDDGPTINGLLTPTNSARASVSTPASTTGVASGGLPSFDTSTADWAQDVGAELLHIREAGESRLRLSLAPAHLGGVQFDLLQTELGIELRVVADSNAARDLLQQNSDSLRERMEQAGLQLAGFHCETGKRGQDQAANSGPGYGAGALDTGDENPSAVTRTRVKSPRILDLYA